MYDLFAMSEAQPTTTITSLDYRRAAQSEVSGRLAPAIVGLVFFAGFLALKRGWPDLNLAEERIAVACLGAIVLAIFADRVPRLSRVLLFAVNVIVVILCVTLTLLGMTRNGSWSYQQLSLVALGLGVTIGAVVSLTQMLQQRDGTSLTALVCIGMTLAASALLLFAGINTMMQTTLTLIAGIVAVMIAGVFHHPLRSSRGMYTFVLAILATQLVSGHLWGEGEGIPIWAGGAVIGAPLFAWIVRIPFIARRRPWQRILIGLIVAAIPAAGACAVTGFDYAQSWSRSTTNFADDSGTSPSSYDTFKPE